MDDLSSKVAELVAAKMKKARADAGKTIRSAVVTAAGGADKLTAGQAEQVADALTALGWSAGDLDVLIADYRTRGVHAEALKAHPARTQKLEADIRRANELKAEIEKMQGEERQLRAFYMPGYEAMSIERRAVEEIERKHPWLFNDAIPPPDRPPAK